MTTPLARTEHPQTSHEAADSIYEQLPELRQVAYTAILKHPGSTDATAPYAVAWVAAW